jgi:hypothetical protein
MIKNSKHPMKKLIVLTALAAFGGTTAMAGISNRFYETDDLSNEELRELQELVMDQEASIENEVNIKIFNPEGKLLQVYTYQYGDICNDPQQGTLSQEVDFLMELNGTLYYVVQD